MDSKLLVAVVCIVIFNFGGSSDAYSCQEVNVDFNGNDLVPGGIAVSDGAWQDCGRSITIRVLYIACFIISVPLIHIKLYFRQDVSGIC